jgi:two-component system, NarL family, sensor histidine kinase DegS
VSSDYKPSSGLPPGLPPLDGSGTGMQRPLGTQVPTSPVSPDWPSQTSSSRSVAHTSASEPTSYPPDRSGTWAADQPAGGPTASRYREAERDDDSASGDDPWDSNPDLLATSKAEYDRIARDLDEIRMLIKQSSSELEKLNQRKVLAGAKTREMEEKIETFSRQEIRATYLASTEAEMRAFMIAEQREQLQGKEKAFERYHGFLRRTIEVLTSLPQAGAPGAWGATAPPWGPAASSQLPDRAAPSRDGTAALSRVIQAQEDVRQRVAQRLHDGPAQSLANVVLTAEICEKLVQSDPRRAQSELGNLKGLVNTTLQDTRKFIFELRPMTLDDLGLVPTLRRYIDDVRAKYQVQVNLVAPQGDQRLPHHMEVPIFRVAQEAIANAVQHGRATQARVTISLQPDAAVLIVEDNGNGFDVEQALGKAAARQTIGIASMQERAEMLGGWLRIESARGHGSRVELNVPTVPQSQRIAQ